MNKLTQLFFYIKRIICYISLIILINPSYALDSFVVKNIRVNGLQRIEIGTVFNYLPVKVGDTLDGNGADKIITHLYDTGFFKDVRVEEEGNTLIIDIKERPIIADLTITGDHAFDHDTLMKSLKENGLAEGKIFDQSILTQELHHPKYFDQNNF